MHPSLFFRPGALLSQPELSAARLDGLLIEVGDGYMPPDVPEDASARIASLAPVLTAGYALSGPTAAWVHGVGDMPPACHHLQRVSAQRSRVHPKPRVVMHDRRLDACDVQTIAGVQVTTPLRTLTDLVLRASRDAEGAQWMHRLARAAPELIPRAREQLESRPRMPGKRAALAALRAMSRYEDVTR